MNLTDAKVQAPQGVVTEYGVFQGTYNPSYITYLDSVTFNSTTFDFELQESLTTPTNKDQCKKDGWKTFNNPTFKNQGDCVSFIASQGKARGNPIANLLRSIF